MNQTLDYDIFNLGWDKFLSRRTEPGEDLGLPSILKSAFFQTSPSNLGSGEATENISLVAGYLQSSNFVTGSAGWQINSDGDVEFNSGIFRGSLIAASIDIPDTTSANSFHVDTSGNAWWGATAIGSAVAKILNTGAATFTSIAETNTNLLAANLPSDANLVAYWSFDEGQGSLYAYDTSESGNTLTLLSIADANWVAGISGTELDLDGTADYAINTNVSFKDNAQGYVSCWFRSDTTVDFQTVWGLFQEVASYDNFYLTFRGNSGRLMVNLEINAVATLSLLTATNTITDTNRHHVIITSDGSTIKLYLDGVDTTLTASTGTNTGQWFASATDAQAFTIGAFKTSNPAENFFNGGIDEFRVGSVGLTAKEAYALFKNPGAKGGVIPAGKITSGSIYSKQITLAVAAGTGDSYIAGGNNLDFANWRGGDANGGAFILGLDDSDGDKGKLFVGNYSTKLYLLADGTDIHLRASSIIISDAQTSTGIIKIVDANDATVQQYIMQKSNFYPSATGGVIPDLGSTSKPWQFLYLDYSQSLTTDGQAVYKKWLDDTTGGKTYATGSSLLIDSDTQEETHTLQSGAWKKVKEIRMEKGGTVSVSFDLKPESGGIPQATAYGRIYKNGSAVGTSRENNNPAAWSTFTEDISSIQAGDYIQLYSATSNASFFAYTRNFDIKIASTLPPILDWAPQVTVGCEGYGTDSKTSGTGDTTTAVTLSFLPRMIICFCRSTTDIADGFSIGIWNSGRQSCLQMANGQEIWSGYVHHNLDTDAKTYISITGVSTNGFTITYERDDIWSSDGYVEWYAFR